MSDTRLSHIAAHRKARGAIRVLALHDTVAPGDRHVVDHPLLHVVLVDTVVQKFNSLFVVLVALGVVPPAQEPEVLHLLGKLDLRGRGGRVKVLGL